MNLSFIFYCKESDLAAAKQLIEELSIADIHLSSSEQGEKVEGVCSIRKAQELVVKLGERKIAGYSNETQILLKPPGK